MILFSINNILQPGSQIIVGSSIPSDRELGIFICGKRTDGWVTRVNLLDGACIAVREEFSFNLSDTRAAISMREDPLLALHEALHLKWHGWN
jgi:hypothetical protein